MNDIDFDLDRIEQELGNEEGVLQGELGSLKALAAELDQRARQARQLADQLAASGAAEVSSRMKSIVVPQVNDAAFERARRARQEAIKVRKEATVQVKQALSVTKRLLVELSRQLEASEHEARETLSRLDAERVAQQQQHAQQAAKAKRDAERAAATVAAHDHAGATAVGGQMSIDQAIASTVIAARPSQRRTQARVKVQTAVDLHTDSNFYMAFSANISEGGIFVATVAVQPIGTDIDVDFTLPTGDHVQAKGKVRWVRDVNDNLPDSFPGMGIQFCDIDPATQEKIRRFVAQRDPMFYVD